MMEVIKNPILLGMMVTLFLPMSVMIFVEVMEKIEEWGE